MSAYYESFRHACLHFVVKKTGASSDTPANLNFLNVDVGDELELIGRMTKKPYNHFYSKTSDASGYVHSECTISIYVDSNSTNLYASHQVVAGSSEEKVIAEFCMSQISAQSNLPDSPSNPHHPENRYIRTQSKRRTLTVWTGQKRHFAQPFSQSILEKISPLYRYLVRHKWESTFFSQTLEQQAEAVLAQYTPADQKLWRIWEDPGGDDFTEVFKTIKRHCENKARNPLIIEMCVLFCKRLVTGDVSDLLQPHIPLEPESVIDDSLKSTSVYDQPSDLKTLPIRRLKLVILGQGRAGKTSLLRALRGVEFSESQDSTVYVEAMEVIQHEVEVSNTWKDVETPISQLIKSVRSKKSTQTPPTISRHHRKPEITAERHELNVLAEDHIRRTTDTDIGNIVIEREELLISNLEGDSTTTIKVFDFAGQRRYSAFQHLFVTRQAIYVVVFD
ncbi:hypothetical protein HK098_008314 [Nowakowskiella sp. JEL0407]|nr:hypothetical protein HK098_008314 [Nowakowskiella sp. JEL0407]